MVGIKSSKILCITLFCISNLLLILLSQIVFAQDVNIISVWTSDVNDVRKTDFIPGEKAIVNALVNVSSTNKDKKEFKANLMGNISGEKNDEKEWKIRLEKKSDLLITGDHKFSWDFEVNIDALVGSNAVYKILIYGKGINRQTVTNSFKITNDLSSTPELTPTPSPSFSPTFNEISSSVFSDTDNIYQIGKVVKILARVEDKDSKIDLVGNIRITSISQNYDSNIQKISAVSSSESKLFSYHWNTSGLNPASDYLVEITVIDTKGNKFIENSLIITLTPNLPTINKLVSSVDLSVKSQGLGSELVRTYLLDSDFSESPLGYGWSYTYMTSIVESTDGFAKLFLNDGSALFYSSNGDGTYKTPKSDSGTLLKNSDKSFLLTEKSGTKLHFKTFSDPRIYFLSKMEDRNGNSLSFNYDLNFAPFRLLLTGIVDSSAQITSFSYDTNGKLRMITSPSGRSVFYDYDDNDNLISFTDIAGLKTAYEYDDKHNLIKITETNEKKTFFTIDEEDRLKTVSGEGENNKITFQYGEPQSNQITITDEPGNQTITTYDNSGNVLDITDHLGNRSEFEYDREQDLVKLTDANNNILSLDYDNKGNIVSVTDPKGNITSATYDSTLNKITSLADANSNITLFEYDQNGNLITVTFPDSATEKYTYDEFGNVISKTDRIGQIINFTYDEKGLLTEKQFPDGTSDKFRYDDFGNLLSAIDENGTISFFYDLSGRINEVIYPSRDSVSYKYDASGNVTEVIYPDKGVVKYDYDGVGRLAEISMSDKTIASYSYDTVGNIVNKILGNGLTTLFEYNESGRLIELITQKSSLEQIFSFLYSYDNVGNRTSITTKDGTIKYVYDSINQLSEIIHPDNSITTYSFDSLGNRVSVQGQNMLVDYETNGLNQYTSVGGDVYDYDNNGNLIEKITEFGTTGFVYDFENRLIQVNTPTETINYTYDSFGRRISKETNEGTTKYIYDGSKVIMEKDDSGTVQASYIYGKGIDEILLLLRNGQEYYYSYDGTNSVTNITDINGDIIDDYSYDEYGVPETVSTVGNPYLFTGRRYEQESGLYYFRNRYYSPDIGRFLTLNSVRFDGGINFYNYVFNNPVNFISPNGNLALSLLPSFSTKSIFTGYGATSVEVSLNGLKNDGLRSSDNNMQFKKSFPNILSSNVLDKQNNLHAGLNFESIFNPMFQTTPKTNTNSLSVMAGDPTFIQVSKNGFIKDSDKSQFNEDLNEELIARIDVPYQDSLVRANVPIFGKAYGANFKEYRVEFGEGDNPKEWFILEQSNEPVIRDISPTDLDDSTDITIQGNIATWDTGLKNYVYLPTHPKDHNVNLKGMYTLRLVVTGNDGDITEDRVTVNVANVIPNAWGGTVTSKNKKVSLSIPEQSLMEPFRLIAIQKADKTIIEPGHSRMLVGNVYEVKEPGESFTKDVKLQIGFSENDFDNRDLNQIGIYGYNVKEKSWEYLKSKRCTDKNLLFTNLNELHSHYTLMSSADPEEGSTLNVSSDNILQARQIKTSNNSPYYLCNNTFEKGIGEWSNRDGSVGGDVTLKHLADCDGKAVKITNANAGGNFAVNVRTTSFDASKYPYVQFDYKIPPDVKTNFLVKVVDRWYEVGFTDDHKVLKSKRVNIANIGQVDGVIADNQWRTVSFDLYKMLKTKTGNSIVEEMVMADWDVSGYMKLAFGHNQKDATYYIDNFSIKSEVNNTHNISGNVVYVDDFDRNKMINKLNGICGSFANDGTIELDFIDDSSIEKGNALKIVSDVSKSGSFAGYFTYLQNLDLRDFNTLFLNVKGIKSNQDILVGLKGCNGTESKVWLSNYLPKRVPSEWSQVKIPLVAFSNITHWNEIENLSISFENRRYSEGVIFVDNIEFLKETNMLVVDNFENVNHQNTLDNDNSLLVNGSAIGNGKYICDTDNKYYQISYEGNIGKINRLLNNPFSFVLWKTELGGIDLSSYNLISFKIKVDNGNNLPHLYLDDGNSRWCVYIDKFIKDKDVWQTVNIPLTEFSEYGVDLTHIEEVQFAFEWEEMTGSICLDDIRFGAENQKYNKMLLSKLSE